jgi:hypothetical protein
MDDIEFSWNYGMSGHDRRNSEKFSSREKKASNITAQFMVR